MGGDRVRHVVFRWLALGVLAFVLTGCGEYNVNWRQKMTVVVETPQGEKTGSSVIQVNFARGDSGLFKFSDGSGVRWNELGEAVVVDLGSGKYLFALLSGAANSLGSAGVNASITFSPDRNASPGLRKVVENVVNQSLGVAQDIPAKAYPMLVTFTDINDPASVKKVDPDNLAATFGAGYKLKRITLEITDQPTTTGNVEGLIDWLETNRSLIVGPSEDANGQPIYRVPRHGGFIRRK